MNDCEKGKILVLKLYQKTISLLISHNRIISIQADDADAVKPDAAIGNIYVGRVQNISHNIGAAFVEIQKGVLTFLPLTEAGSAYVTNRKPDGTLKTGDELLVRLIKEPVKTKLAGVSTKLSIAGSYTVIATGNDGIKISSKLGGKYTHLYKNLTPLQDIARHFTVTIRTNAANSEDASAVIAEAEALAVRMERILAAGDKRTCFSCLYQSPSAWLTFIKNCYQSEYDEIITDEKEIYETLLHEGNKTDEEHMPAVPVRFYENDRLPLYKLYSIETRIGELLAKKVWLRSGAYLVIEQTEALVAIDVNTGKYESRKKPEETYLKINLEAAEAIAEAMRARNLSGMILVDFINMKKTEHVRQLTEYMKSLLKKDAVPSYVVDITGLGLMEITRQKKNKPFAEQMRSIQKGYTDS